MFSLIFNYMSSFRPKLFKGKYIFSSRIVEKFSLCFSTFFNSLFTNVVKLASWGVYFWRRGVWEWFCLQFQSKYLFDISIKTSVNWATGSSDKINPSDNRDIHSRVWSDSQSVLSNFQCSAESSSSLEDAFRITGKWSLPQRSLWVCQSNSSAKRRITNRSIQSRKIVTVGVSVCMLTSI